MSEKKTPDKWNIYARRFFTYLNFSLFELYMASKPERPSSL